MRLPWWIRTSGNPETKCFYPFSKGATVKRRFATSFLAILTTIVAAGPAVTAGASEQHQTAEVKVDNFSFGPDTVTVPVNTTVTWVNRDDVPHVIASTDGVFRSKALDTDDKYSFTFDKPGTYSYFCALHPKMVGKIVVH
jgi:plastocyanin